MIVNNNNSNKGLEFVPLLEFYLLEKLNFTVNPKSEVIDHYRNYNKSFTSNGIYKDKVISLDIDNPIDSDYILVTEVKEVIALINSGSNSNSPRILCNLVTHYRELIAAGFECELVNKGNESRLPTLKSPKHENTMGPCINPDIDTDIKELKGAKYYIKYFPEGYKWDNNNYSNEYCKVNQLANLFGKEVKVAITNSELKFWNK